MSLFECKKCKSKKLVMRQNAKNPNATELICGDCGTWQKFVGKEEIRLFEMKNCSCQDCSGTNESSAKEHYVEMATSNQLEAAMALMSAAITLRENTGGDFYANITFDGKRKCIDVDMYEPDYSENLPRSTWELHFDSKYFSETYANCMKTIEALTRRK